MCQLCFHFGKLGRKLTNCGDIWRIVTPLFNGTSHVACMMTTTVDQLADVLRLRHTNRILGMLVGFGSQRRVVSGSTVIQRLRSETNVLDCCDLPYLRETPFNDGIVLEMFQDFVIKTAVFPFLVCLLPLPPVYFCVNARSLGYWNYFVILQIQVSRLNYGLDMITMARKPVAILLNFVFSCCRL